MTGEQIKQTSKITEFARNMVKQSNYPIDLQDHIIATCMVVVTEATKELEKENAELKDDNKVMADNYSKMEQKFFDNLTKAKELLKRYVPYRQITDSKAYKDLAEETEQFLKDN